MHKLHATLLKRGPLSPKESVVLRYLCEGYLRKEIADKVKRTESTVGKQIESIASKLECHCSAEIVATAVALGLVKVEITADHSLFIRSVAMVLLLNVMTTQFDIRQVTRLPRPSRTLRAASRTARQQYELIERKRYDGNNDITYRA